MLIAAAAIAVVGLGLHASGWYFKSRDFIYCLDPWYNQIRAGGGFNSLNAQVGNYNIPYQVFIAVMTYLPICARSAYKLVSCLFDLVLAIAAGALVFQVRGRDDKSVPILAGAVCFALPTVAMNSGWWAQCDSIWVSFCLLSLVAFNMRRYVPCFVLYGCAFAFKLQAIFLLPFFVFAYVRIKRFSVLHFILIPAVMIALSLPGLMMGRSIADIFSIYAEQAGYKTAMYLNYPSFWALFVGADVDYSAYLKAFAVLLTIAVVMIEVAFLFARRIDLAVPLNAIMVSALLSFTVVLFLPAMHERYAYLVEALLLVMAFCDTRFVVPAVLVQLVSIRTYIAYLLQEMIAGLDPSIAAMWPLSLVNLIALGVVVALVFAKAPEDIMKIGASPLVERES